MFSLWADTSNFHPLSHICEHPPPPKPPDWVAIMTLSLKLSLLVTTAKHFAETQPTYVYSFSFLQTSLQLFDEKSQWHNSVWIAISTVSVAILDRISMPTYAHLQGTMLRLVNGGIGN
ncbi:hypothetical protein L195_g047231 [Trifolium pratense]|uniref:Uncharacterized protein n=1 Tax=Trifolium pratense TaxID=57577 RepID=A0A2K3MJY0_TRIPR|nr:hypothetical protein L195_g047231 [Trifolium pratense]